MQKHCPSSCDFCYGKSTKVQRKNWTLTATGVGELIGTVLNCFPMQQYEPTAIYRGINLTLDEYGFILLLYSQRLYRQMHRGCLLFHNMIPNHWSNILFRVHWIFVCNSGECGEGRGYNTIQFLPLNNLFLIVDWETLYGCGKFLSDSKPLEFKTVGWGLETRKVNLGFLRP